MIRAKGHFWIATRPDWVAEFSLAGALSSVRPLGQWWASVPRDCWPSYPQGRGYLESHWSEPFGDRRQELVFIRTGMDEDRLRARLNTCLLGEDWGDSPGDWARLPDRFPAWRRATEAA